MSNIELYRAGYTLAEIKDKNLLSDSDIENFIKEIASEDLKSHKIKIKERIIELNNQGYSVNAINKKLYVSASIIKDVLKQNK